MLPLYNHIIVKVRSAIEKSFMNKSPSLNSLLGMIVPEIFIDLKY